MTVPPSKPPRPPVAVIMELARGYQVSQALFVAAELGLMDRLANGARDSDDLAAETETHAPSLNRLLRALAAFGIFREVEPGRFALTDAGEMLRSDAPHSMLPLVRMWSAENFVGSFERLRDCVATGRNAFDLAYGLKDGFSYYQAHPEDAAVVTAAMTTISRTTGPAIAAAYDFAGVNTMVDVAGGQGRVLASILERNPNLRAKLLELPRVASQAGAPLRDAGVAARCEIVAGDMFVAVPAGADLYLICNVIHDWDDEHSVRVLKICRQAMGEGARLLIADRVMPDCVEAGPPQQALTMIDLIMLVRTAGGRERTRTDFERLLSAASLRLTRVIPTAAPQSLVEAVPA